MKLLRFDPSGALHAEYGVQPEWLEELYPQLDELRNDVVEEDPEQYASGQIPLEKRPLDARFSWLPSEMLLNYREDPVGSELAKIFNTANRLHAEVDAVVVLGIGGSYMGARALFEALCHPYHNELTRGARGSKPRLYFGGNNVDNDALAALLDRLAAGGYGDDPAESQWALCAISKSGGTLETAVAFRQFLPLLEAELGADAPELLPGRVLPVTGSGSQLAAVAEAIGCGEIFGVPEGVGGRFSVLSSVGLLPAAIVGIDCVQLLEGAIAMNEHFATAPPEENVVLRYTAINHLLEKHRDVRIRVLSAWSQALEALGLWYDQLLAESLGKGGRGATPLTTVNTRDLHSRHQQHQQGPRDKVFNNLVVETCRHDPLAVGDSTRDQDRLNDLSGKTLGDILAAAVEGTNEALHDDGRPTTNIILSEISPFTMGQLMQMLMLATVVEGRLLGINPYGQPGVEQYKLNMNRMLGRS